MRVNGGVIGSYNQATNRQARGVWGMQEIDALKRGFRFPRFYEGWDLTSLYNSQPIYNSTNVVTLTSLVVGNTAPQGLFFKPDGTKVYVADNGSDTVYEYDLSTAWDLTTMSYNSVSFSTSGQDNSPNGVFISSDGYSLYIVGSSSDFVYQYAMPTAWDLSSVSTEGVKSLDVNPPETAPADLHFSTNGENLYIVGSGLDAILSYTLSTAWDISTATYNNQSTSLLTYEGGLTGITMSADGTKVILVGGSNDNMYQFFLSTAWDISTLQTPPQSVIDINPPESLPTCVTFDSTGTKIFFLGSTTDNIYAYDLGTPYDITIPGWDSSSYLSVTSVVAAIKWKPDGTKVYVYAGLSDAIESYSLSTAWDLTTATADGVNLVASFTAPTIMFFSDDGSNLFVSGSNGDISQFSLSNPWDLSSAGSEVLDVLVISDVRDAQFFDSGNTLIAMTTTTVLKYSLSTPFDIATASLDSSWSSNFNSATSETVAPRSSYISPEGSKLFVADSGSNRVYQFNMTTSFDVTTTTYSGIYLSASYNDSSASTGPGTALYGLSFKTDGKIMYLADQSTDKIYPIYLSSL
jgi:DNA-binding beta-propeller fold protein YncE